MMDSRAAERLGEHARLIRVLEARGLLDRALEFLPSRRADRGAPRVGTRPHAPGARDHPELLEDRAAWQPRADRHSRGSVPRRASSSSTSRTSSPSRFKPQIQAAPAAPRDHRDADRRQHDQPDGAVLRAARGGRDRRERRAGRARVRDRARGVRRAPALARDRGARPQGRGEGAVRRIFQISRMVRRAVYWLLQNYPQQLDIEPMVMRFRQGVVERVRRRCRRSSRAAARSAMRRTRSSSRPRACRRRSRSGSRRSALATQIVRHHRARARVSPAGARSRRVSTSRSRTSCVSTSCATKSRRSRSTAAGARWRARRCARRSRKEQRSLLRSALRARGASAASDAALAAWLDKRRDEIARVQRGLDDMQMTGPWTSRRCRSRSKRSSTARVSRLSARPPRDRAG